MFQSEVGGKATNSDILSEPTEIPDDGGGKALSSCPTPEIRGIPPSPVLSASTHEERVSVRVLRSRNRSRKILTEEEQQKLKEKIKTVMAAPCKWDEDSSDDDSDDEEEEKKEEPKIFKKEESVKTNVFIELKDAWSDDEA
jgi:hypothetical protein